MDDRSKKVIYTGKIVLLVAVGAGIGYTARPYIDDPIVKIKEVLKWHTKVKVVKETKTRYKYITANKPATFEEYKMAFDMPIQITGVMKNNWLNVTASDTYKQSDKGFKMQIAQKGNWKVYAGLGVGAGVMYMIMK